MSALTLVLVLTSAAIHACWNLWTKQVGGVASRGALMWLLTALSAAIYAPLAVFLALHRGWLPGAQAGVLIGGSSVLHAVYFLLLVGAYRDADLSLVYPIARGSGQLLAAIGGVLLFAERATPLTAAGVLLVVAGVWLLGARGPRRPDARVAGGIVGGLSIGWLIGVYTLWDGWAVKRAGVPPVVFYWAGELLRTLLFTPAALADRAGVAALWRTQRPRVLAIAALSPLAYILILIAMRTGPISHIAPARELSVLLGAWLGGRVLGEGERARRLVAAGALAAGVVALAWA